MASNKGEIVYTDGDRDKLDVQFATVRRHLSNAMSTEGDAFPEFLTQTGTRVAVNPAHVARVLELKED